MTTQKPADDLDRRILDAVQQDIPLVSRPWEAVAGFLGISEAVLLQRLERLSREGIVRGISPIIESRPFGITAATLVALPVPDERIRTVADIISRYPEVSHNFRREHRYSLWFTLSATDEKALQDVLGEILEQTGFSRDDILDLPTVKKIKIDVRFPIAGSGNGGPHGPG
ncbi:MAG: AsnC family transcriptional regulator [Methanomicrobiaceae archaeon]|nr:AsnC family transcriptional regulator [Methanomicrobiaceae archaeon]